MPNRLQVAKVANRLLTVGKVKGPPVPVWDLAKMTGVTLKRGKLPEDLSGFLVRDNKTIIIGVNTRHSGTRQRFTVAHELGHLLLHPEQNYVDRNFPIFYRDERSSTAEIRAEIEANQFAADLLMPKWMILEWAKASIDMEDDNELVDKLADRFNVSSQAMTFRLTNLGLAEALDRRQGKTRKYG